MSLKVTKDATASPVEYSSGTGVTPVTVSLTLDGTNSPATVSASPIDAIYVWADDDTTDIDNYSTVTAEIDGSDTGITWLLSLDDFATAGASSVSIGTMDVSSTHAATRIYARATALNDGSVLTANYTTADIKVTGTSNPV